MKKSLAEDRKRRADEAGAEVEALVKADPPLIQEAWYRIQGWYKAAVDRAPPPARATLKRITAERVALYSRFPPPGDSIPVEIEPFEVEDGVPDEGEIEWAVKRLSNNRAGGPSRMQAEDLKGWLAAARRGEQRETADKEGGGQEDTREGAENWARVVELVQTAFRDGDLAEEATWQAVVLIPKGKKYDRCIGLVEVMWKVVAAILNCRFTYSITDHNVLHGFSAGCDTGTATLKSKLLQQLAAFMEEVIYMIFLNLTKVYNALDRSRFLEILKGYDVGPNARRLLTTYWRRLTMVARAAGYYGMSFGGDRGVTQGNPLSPTIFNVVVDAVVRHWVNGIVKEANTRG